MLLATLENTLRLIVDGEPLALSRAPATDPTTTDAVARAAVVRWISRTASPRELATLEQYLQRGAPSRCAIQDERRRRARLCDALSGAIPELTVVRERPSARVPASQRAVSPTRAATPSAHHASSESRTWFELRVVDEEGSAVAGLDVVLLVDGARRVVTTDHDGVARARDTHGSFAFGGLASLSATRAALRERWSRALTPQIPEGARVHVHYLRPGVPQIPLERELRSTLVLRRPLYRARLIGMYFETDRCFVLPTTMPGIRGVKQLHDDHGTGRLLVVGHTDTAGDDAWNLALSLERADAVSAFLRNDTAAWKKWFADGVHFKKRWGTREVQLMLSALPEGAARPFWLGTPTGTLDEATRAAVTRFQTYSNEARGTSLKVDGDPGPMTRAALIEAYMALSGTSLPAACEVVTHGCGEHFPAVETGDGVARAENRRVEVFYFDGPIAPPPPGKTSPRGASQYPTWVRQVTDTVDFSHGGIGIFVHDDDDHAVASANVTLSGPHAQEGRTDRDGIVHFYNLPDGHYELLAERAGYRDERVTFTLPLKPAAPADASPAQAPPRSGGAREGLAESAAPQSPSAPASAPRPATVGTRGGDATQSETTVKVKLTEAVRLVVFVRDAMGAPLMGVPCTLRVPDARLLELEPAGDGGDARTLLTDARGRVAVQLSARIAVTGPITLAVNQGTVDRSPPFLSLTQPTLTIAPSEIAGGDGKLTTATRGRGSVVRHAVVPLERAPLKHRYLWQNPAVRAAAFPNRNLMLRRFLALMEWFRVVELAKAKFVGAEGKPAIGTAPVREVEAMLALDEPAAFYEKVRAAGESLPRRMASIPTSYGSRTPEHLAIVDEAFFYPTAGVDAPPARPKAPNDLEPPPERGPDEPIAPDADAPSAERTAYAERRKSWERETAAWKKRKEAFPREKAAHDAAVKKFNDAMASYEKKYGAYLAKSAGALQTSAWSVLKSHVYAYWKFDLGPLSHNKLVERVDAYCKANTEKVPGWLHYMVIHFSGILYKSAHDSFYREERLLFFLRGLEVPIELGRDPKRPRELPDVDVVELLLEAEHALASEAGTLPITLRDEVKALLANEHLETGQWVTAGLSSKRKALDLLERLHLSFFALEGVFRLAPAEGDLLEAYWDGVERLCALLVTRGPEVRSMRADNYRFEPAVWDEIVRRTHLLRVSPKTRAASTTWPEWFPSASNPVLASALSAWRSADTGDLCRNARAAMSAVARTKAWAAENCTGWRSVHKATLDPSAVRIVCNETEEHLLHARGGSPPGGLRENAADSGTVLTAALSLAAYDNAAGGSIFSTDWRFTENSSATVRPGKPSPLVDYESGFEFYDSAVGSEKVKTSTWEANGLSQSMTRTYYIPRTGPLRLQRRTESLIVSPRSVEQNVVNEEMLTWAHQAPIVRVLDDDLSLKGYGLLTFQTSFPIGINMDRKDVEGVSKGPFRKTYIATYPRLEYSTTHPRVPTFLAKLVELSGDN